MNSSTNNDMNSITNNEMNSNNVEMRIFGVFEDSVGIDDNIQKWYYIDNDNNYQGPFYSSQMDDWYNNEYLEEEL